MIDELKPYPEYKDSGLSWLGKVPKHWVCTPLKRIVGINLRDLPEATDPDFRFHYLDIGSVATGYLRSKPSRIRFGDAPSRARRIVRRGDTIVSTVRTYLRAVYHFDNDVADHIVSTGFAVLTPPADSYRAFFGFLAESTAFVDCVVAQSNGIAYPAISEERLGQIPIVFPPDPNEQKAIADYLKAIDRQVRRFIRNRRRLIEVLNKQKQAIINRAVTRGLDPNAPLKPSGIDWLGGIPKHWRLIKLRAALKPISERNRPDLPLLSVVREKGVIIRDVEDMEGNHNFIPDDLSNYKVVRSGQFAMNKMKAWQGSYGISEHDGIVSPAYFIFDLIADIYPRFFHFALRSRAYVPFFTQASDGVRTGQWDLSTPRMKEIPFLVPPPVEQEEIAEWIPSATDEIDRAIEKAQREIDLIREYRTRLIADVVTGKVDVRHLAPPPGSEDLQETADELEPLGDAAGELDDEALAGEVAHADD